MSNQVLAASIAQGFYPERQFTEEKGLDQLVENTLGRVAVTRRARPSRFRAIVKEVKSASEGVAGLSDQEIVWQARALRRDLRARGFTVDLAGKVFALVRESAGRKLGLRHYDVQLIGGWALLNGMVAEMATGEGKTLTATLAACTAALSGLPVHIVTVNDYLTSRDARWMGPVYEALGLSVGAITHEMNLQERQEAYRRDVTYCTNKEVAFDYLRDRLQLGRKPGRIQARLERLYGGTARLDRLRLRGLYFGIVDEADSVLIDEARTPLIISGPGDDSYESEIYREALDLSGKLSLGPDYRIDFPAKSIELTDGGKARLEEMAQEMGGVWTGRIRREEMVRKALAARHHYHRDKHYLVKSGKVEIVDEYTGRVMPGRLWEGGLHQLIETKEDCPVTTQTEILARISYQRFFRRYLALAGMTGTAREAARELWSVYRLPVVSIPPNRPLRRRNLGQHAFRTAREKWSAVVTRIAEVRARGRPVLVGTRTVAASEHLAGLLEEAGLECRVLNAKQNEEEAKVIAQAGREGQITVATNMAGRGTDILLESGVAERGGLHVIATERHDALRIDRQLFGRCGRQGDPGTFESFVSMEDDLLKDHPARALGILGPGVIRPGRSLGRRLAGSLFRRSQRAAERRHEHMRRDLLRLDESVESALAFSGTGE